MLRYVCFFFFFGCILYKPELPAVWLQSRLTRAFECIWGSHLQWRTGTGMLAYTSLAQSDPSMWPSSSLCAAKHKSIQNTSRIFFYYYYLHVLSRSFELDMPRDGWSPSASITTAKKNGSAKRIYHMDVCTEYLSFYVKDLWLFFFFLQTKTNETSVCQG